MHRSAQRFAPTTHFIIARCCTFANYRLVAGDTLSCAISKRDLVARLIAGVSTWLRSPPGTSTCAQSVVTNSLPLAPLFLLLPWAATSAPSPPHHHSLTVPPTPLTPPLDSPCPPLDPLPPPGAQRSSGRGIRSGRMKAAAPPARHGSCSLAMVVRGHEEALSKRKEASDITAMCLAASSGSEEMKELPTRGAKTSDNPQTIVESSEAEPREPTRWYARSFSPERKKGVGPNHLVSPGKYDPISRLDGAGAQGLGIDAVTSYVRIDAVTSYVSFKRHTETMCAESTRGLGVHYDKKTSTVPVELHCPLTSYIPLAWRTRGWNETLDIFRNSPRAGFDYRRKALPLRVQATANPQ
ncbi:uncharacterized protein LOC133354036 isoform X2 [Lethenteron reissneri]|uniref:uncharacterized protein LOC133354036 isoform X2 n=1 Tax=Lethenteron reissneri TaxID=7753 RepID=UPI002AB60562|nr:uncharacterized protein LOC133354036 isoform X2 [Lethenteron reissneri]